MAVIRHRPIIHALKNAEYDALYQKALLENDDATRMNLYQQMDKIIIEEAPIVPLFYDGSAAFCAKGCGRLGRKCV